jgi:hypothetical protein
VLIATVELSLPKKSRQIDPAEISNIIEKKWQIDPIIKIY